MTDFGRSPGPRISAAPPTYSPVLMYLGIQVLAGCQGLEIATFANTFRCFWTSGNPGFEQFRGARNRDFREEVPPLCGIGEPRFSRLPRSSSRILMARDLGARPDRPIRGSNGPLSKRRFDRLGPSGPGWLVPRSPKSGLPAPNSAVLWSGNGGLWATPRTAN